MVFRQDASSEIMNIQDREVARNRVEAYRDTADKL